MSEPEPIILWTDTDGVYLDSVEWPDVTTVTQEMLDNPDQRYMSRDGDDIKLKFMNAEATYRIDPKAQKDDPFVTLSLCSGSIDHGQVQRAKQAG